MYPTLKVVVVVELLLTDNMYNFFTFEKKNIIRNHNKRKLDDDKTKLNTLISFTLPALLTLQCP